MRLLAATRAYAAHADPASETANFIAILVGTNGPFYPLYILLLAGHEAAVPGLLTMLASPFFLAIPLLARHSARAGRLALPLLGTLNTLWCLKLLGTGSAVGLFFLPCILLAALLCRRDEWPLLWLAAALPLGLALAPDGWMGQALITLNPAQAGRLAALNTASVAALIFVVTMRLAGLMRRAAPRSE